MSKILSLYSVLSTLHSFQKTFPLKICDAQTKRGKNSIIFIHSMSEKETAKSGSAGYMLFPLVFFRMDAVPKIASHFTVEKKEGKIQRNDWAELFS